MRRALVWGAAGIAGVVVLLVVGTVAFFAFGGAARLKPLVEDAASVAIGQEVTLKSFSVEPGWDLTTFRLTGLAVANRPWAGDRPMAELAELTIVLRPKTVLWGPLQLPRVEAHQGSLRLMRNTEGKANWTPLEGVAETAAPETRSEFPEIGELAVSDIAFAYEDTQDGISKTGRIDAIQGSVNEADGVALTLDGTMDEQGLTARFAGGSFNRLVEGTEPYPVDFELGFNDVSITAKGEIAEPGSFEGVDVRLTLSGRNFADLYPVIPAALPATPPFTIEGDLARRGTAVSLSNFTGQMGDSDVHGTLTYDTGGERPHLKGTINSERLDFDDLAPLIGAAPKAEKTATGKQAAKAEQPGLFPDEPIPVERFKIADLEIDLNAENVVDATVPVTRLKAHFGLENARLEVRPFELGFEGGGEASGEIAVNAREATPSADVDLNFQEISLKPFFEKSEFVEEMGGLFSGELYLLGTGASLADIAGTARGHGVVTYRDGTVSGLIVEAAGLDVVEALALVVGDDTPVAVHCGGAGFVADGGRITIRQAFVDTTDSLLTSAGWLDLRQQTLDMQIEAEPKDFSLIDMAAPVRVSGKIETPEITIGGLDPLPFLELGDQESLDCKAAYQQLFRVVQPKT